MVEQRKRTGMSERHEHGSDGNDEVESAFTAELEHYKRLKKVRRAARAPSDRPPAAADLRADWRYRRSTRSVAR